MATIHSVTIDCRLISDWSSFHNVFGPAFGFPDFYGRNLDAWIDCMTYLDTDFSGFQVPHGDLVMLELEEIGALAKRLPDVARTIMEMCAFVNFRRVELGDPPLLIVSGNI